MKLFSNDKRKQMKIFRVNVFFAIVHKSLLLLKTFYIQTQKTSKHSIQNEYFLWESKKKGLTTDCQSFVIDVYFVYIIYFLLLFVPSLHLFSSYRMNAKQIL